MNSIFWGVNTIEKPIILMCDPDSEARGAVKSYLSGENYEVHSFESGEDVLDELNRRRADLIIMETLLSDGDGFELCRKIRSRSNIPIIFLSRRSEEFDRVLGLKMGADDFMGKPFSLRELSARVEAVLKRVNHSTLIKCVRVGELTLYHESYTAYVDGNPVELIPSDFKLLYCLAANVGRVLSREKLLDAVWGMESTGSQRSVDTQIKRIRKAVCLPNVHFAIKSIYGVGYKLELAE
ncbi:MAG: response regulator transcription factor [Oscillospiraceae bacterium]|nr:response regulator transcription factor [Oscillospiraceae bacterium]